MREKRNNNNNKTIWCRMILNWLGRKKSFSKHIDKIRRVTYLPAIQINNQTMEERNVLSPPPQLNPNVIGTVTWIQVLHRSSQKLRILGGHCLDPRFQRFTPLFIPPNLHIYYLDTNLLALWANFLITWPQVFSL